MITMLLLRLEKQSSLCRAGEAHISKRLTRRPMQSIYQWDANLCTSLFLLPKVCTVHQ